MWIERDETLIDVLDRAESFDSTKFGLSFLDRQEKSHWRSWPDIRIRARCTSNSLYEIGIRAGDRVGLILPTCPEFIELFFAIQALGAIPVALYPPVRLGRLTEYHQRTSAMLRSVSAVAVITDTRIAKILGETVFQYRPRLGVVYAEGLHQGSERSPVSGDPHAIAMVQFSSGTTVEPKPVALTHRQVLANAGRITQAIASLLPPEEVPTGVSWLPLYHDMGLIGCVIPSVLAPGPLTLIPPELFLAKPSVWLRAISRTKANISPAPNFAYALCVERVDDKALDGCDLSSWRMALNGAEPIAAGTLRAFEERFRKFGFRNDAMLPVYGLSEAALAVTFTPPGTRYRTTRFSVRELAQQKAQPDPQGTELVSVGRPLPDFSVQIRVEGQRLEEGHIGRVFVAGPSLMHGYLDRVESPIVDNWLDTGDVGFLFEGDLYITGRAKDVLVLRGQNHAPHELERAVDSISGVRTGCAAAVAEIHEAGERVLLFIEVREFVAGLAESCRAAVIEATGVAVDEIILLQPGTLPRTSSGKIRRGETLRQYQSQTLAPPDKISIWTVAGAFARSGWGYLASRLFSN